MLACESRIDAAQRLRILGLGPRSQLRIVRHRPSGPALPRPRLPTRLAPRDSPIPRERARLSSRRMRKRVPMRILLTNDDGIHAAGLKLLERSRANCRTT